jgi:hypothetical protein
MSEAATFSITPFPFEVAALSYEYLGAGKVRASLEIRTGEPLSYILSTAMLVQSVNLAFEFINNNARSVLTDLNVF